jgi:hypothetical protein
MHLYVEKRRNERNILHNEATHIEKERESERDRVPTRYTVRQPVSEKTFHGRKRKTKKK